MENSIHFGMSVSPNRAEDFAYFRSLCDNEDGWTLNYDSDVTVHSREFPGTTAKCIRVRGLIAGVSAETVFRCLSDDHYRDQWDTVCAESNHICTLDARTNLAYYCLRCPFPLQNRDVVFQRSWSEVENGFIIMNHSVELPTHPPRPGIVRAISHITGYYMATHGNDCVATYLSHSDPKVSLPQWLCNRIGTLLAPGVFRKLFSAATRYEEWKEGQGKGAVLAAKGNYADEDLLLEWGFPLPAISSSVPENGGEEKSDSESDSEFYSADEDEPDSNCGKSEN